MNEVAKEIVLQIGRGAFAMMGTNKDMWFSENSLVFKIRGSRKWNKIKVELNSSDLYNVTFYKIGGAHEFKITYQEVVDISVEQLHGLIERETGLYLSVPGIRLSN